MVRRAIIRCFLSVMLVFVLGAIAPRLAGAAACCVSATSFGVGRLMIWEQVATGIQLGHSRTMGQFDSSGSLRTSDGLAEGVTQLQPWGIVRLHERIQLQGWIPVLMNDRAADGRSQVAGGLGDIGIAGRFELVSIGQYRGLPGLALTATAIAPTGRRVEDTSPPLFAGTTGRGAWGGSAAIEAEYAFLPWFARLDASVAGFVPFERADTGRRQCYGALFRAMLSAGRELRDDLVLALAWLGEWETALRLGEAAVPDSAAYIYSLITSLSWRWSPHWTAVASITSTLWPSGGGKNRDARLGGTLGVRYGFF